MRVAVFHVFDRSAVGFGACDGFLARGLFRERDGCVVLCCSY